MILRNIEPELCKLTDLRSSKVIQRLFPGFGADLRWTMAIHRTDQIGPSPSMASEAKAFCETPVK